MVVCSILFYTVINVCTDFITPMHTRARRCKPVQARARLPLYPANAAALLTFGDNQRESQIIDRYRLQFSKDGKYAVYLNRHLTVNGCS